LEPSKTGQGKLSRWSWLSLLVQQLSPKLKAILALEKKNTAGLKPAELKKLRTKKERLIRIVIFAVLGGALGALCDSLPPEYQSACQSAVKLLSLLSGGG
jgi:hypothetical protein